MASKLCEYTKHIRIQQFKQANIMVPVLYLNKTLKKKNVTAHWPS